MLFYYAELNSNKICVGISMLSSEVVTDHMISITSLDGDLLNRKFENGIWSDTKFLPNSSEIELGRVERLEFENQELKQQVAQTNADLVEFMEFIMNNGGV